ncbi:MAG: RluA family pseudouridine synthase [Acholeplasmatales bacterium]|nr:RluA family pseudouridine synthase [Acholeplasmatales bacterium]
MIINYPIYNDGNLLDFLKSFHLGKAKIYNLFLNKNVLLNNHVAKQTDFIKCNDIVSIIYDEEIDYKLGSGLVDVLYEDEYFLIVNKKRGIIIHDGKDNDIALCNDIAKYYYDNGIYLSVKFPNRIDKDTSGIMIFCKDMLTLTYMNYLIENHDIVKEYLAICGGKLKNKSGKITYRIGRDRHVDKMRVSSTGLDALTEYKVLKECNDYSLVRCRIKTGRTHQIRVHMSYIGNPILGDTLYGGSTKYGNNTLLHSYRVEFIHPVTLEKIEVLAPIPPDMKGFE